MILCADFTSLWNAYVSKVGQNFYSWNSAVSEQFMVLLLSVGVLTM